MERNSLIDITKLIMAFLIVALHCNILNDQDVYLSYYMKEGLCRIAVPLFLMFSGFYLFKSVEVNQIKKWLKKIIILYFIWMVIYSPFWFNIKSVEYIKETLLILSTGYFHLWYVLSLFISSYLLYLIKDHVKLIIFFALSFIAMSILIQYAINYNVFPELKNNPILWKHHEITYRNVFMVFPFLSVGFLYHKYKEKVKNISNIKVLLIMLMTLIFALYELNYNYVNSDIVSFDVMLWLIIFSPLLFLYLINIKHNLKYSDKISSIANGIFFSHILFFQLFNSKIEGTISLTLVVFVSAMVFSIILLKLKIKIF